MKNQKGFAHILLLLLIVVGIAGWWLYLNNSLAPTHPNSKSTEPKNITPPLNDTYCSDFNMTSCPIHKGCSIACTSSMPDTCSCNGKYEQYSALEQCLLSTYTFEEIPSPANTELRDFGIYIQYPFEPSPNVDKTEACFSNFPNEKIYGYLQLKSANNSETKQILDKLGIKHIQSIRNNTYHALFPANLQINKELTNVTRWIGVVESKHKVDKDLWEGKVGNWAITPEGNVKLSVRFFKGLDNDEAKSVLSRYHLEVENYYALGDYIVYTITANKDIVKSLATENTVQFIGIEAPPPVTHN